MLDRAHHRRRVAGLLRRHPVVALLGARQIGKTTLARQIASAWKGATTWFDLEDPRSDARLEPAMLALERLRGLVIVDEIQRRPDLFPLLRVLADRRPRRARFLILGSASPSLVRGSSESLAGRVAHYVLPGLSLMEVGVENLDRLWWRGGFPASYLARSDADAAEWRREFVATFLERDLVALGIGIAPAALRRLWMMLAHHHGNLWNGAELARSLAVSEATVRRYLDLLAGMYMVQILPPWHANLAKRQVKSPKVYVSDAGMLHSLLGLRSAAELQGHPKVGASWEGFALQQVVERLAAPAEGCHFWRTQDGAELDLLVVHGARRLGFEMKHTDAPKLTRSAHVALSDLQLERLDVVFAGSDTFPLGPRARALALRRVGTDLRPLAR